MSNGSGQHFEHLLRDDRGVGALAEILQYQRELVAAQPADGVAGAHRVREASRHRYDQLVARRVAQRVVDHLEAVQVDEHHRSDPVFALGLREALGEPVLEQRPVGQARQVIVVRQVNQPLLGALAFGDVLGDARDAIHDARWVAHREGALVHPTHGAVGPHDAEFLVVVAERGLPARRRHAGVVARMDRVQPGREVGVQRLGVPSPDLLERRADVHEALERRVGDPEHLRDVSRELPEQLLAVAQRRLGQAMLLAHRRFAQLPLNGRNQAGELALDDVVVRPGLHRLHRRVLADVSGDDDERQVARALLHDFQRAQPRESGHAVVGNDDVPRRLIERREHLLLGLDARVLHFVAAAPQFRQQQQHVVFAVLDEQHAQRFGRIVHLRRYGSWLRRNQ